MVRGIIGINDWEREKEQEILINIVLFTNLQKAGETDKIEDCVNYRTIAKKVFTHTETAKRYTVESLANDIAKICLNEPGVKKAKVRVEKPGAVRFSFRHHIQITLYNIRRVLNYRHSVPVHKQLHKSRL